MKQNKRIFLLVADGLEGRGGIERFATYFAEEAKSEKRKILVEVIKTRLLSSGPLKHFSTLPALAFFLFKLLLSTPDICHINIAPRGSTYRKLIYFAACKIIGVRALIHLHGSGYDDYYRSIPHVRRLAVRWMFKSASAVVVLGTHWANFMENEVGANREKIFIAYNGVPDRGFTSRNRNEIVTILFLGQIGIRKGVDTLLYAMSGLSKNFKWRLILAGSGDVTYWESVANSLGVSDRVTFTGWLEESAVTEAIRNADILVLPSRAENQPVAIIEAMALGLPVIASNIGAIPEQVVHGETGLLIEPGDTTGLISAIEQMLRSPEQAAMMGRAGRDRYLALFSIQSCVNKFQRIYDSICEKS